MSSHQVIVEHAVGATKVVTGGAGVGVTTYAAISHLPIEQATAIATLTAAVATTIYFTVAGMRCAWSWYKEWKAGKPVGE